MPSHFETAAVVRSGSRFDNNFSIGLLGLFVWGWVFGKTRPPKVGIRRGYKQANWRALLLAIKYGQCLPLMAGLSLSRSVSQVSRGAVKGVIVISYSNSAVNC
jgi:hypothetical protein